MYVVDVKRTPVGKFLGSLSNLTAPELTKPLFSYFIDKYPFLHKETDEVIMGHVLSAGEGMNPARQASVGGGISVSVPSYGISHVCASGMNAVIQASRGIRAGDVDLVLAGGMENMSKAPFLLENVRKGFRYGERALIDSLQHDGLCCGLRNEIMGVVAEYMTKKYNISRKKQDEFSLNSHRKAIKAQKNKVFSTEIIKTLEISSDEGPRSDTTLQKLSSLKPAFKNDGSVTVGNSSTINDGAALSLLASENALKKYGLKPIARVVDYSFVGLDPKDMGMGPKYAIEKLLKKNSLSLKDIDLFEINEAFAVQVLSVVSSLKIDETKLNIYGGAISIGHPLGMSGVRIIGTLINGLKRTNGELGIASLCVGGGQGGAVLIENI